VAGSYRTLPFSVGSPVKLFVLRLTAHIRIGLLPDKGQSSLHRRNQPFLICCAAATGYVAQHFFNAIARLAIQRTVRVPSYYTQKKSLAVRGGSDLLRASGTALEYYAKNQSSIYK
jgi:hypothetical protein